MSDNAVSREHQPITAEELARDKEPMPRFGTSAEAVGWLQEKTYKVLPKYIAEVERQREEIERLKEDSSRLDALQKLLYCVSDELRADARLLIAEIECQRAEIAQLNEQIAGLRLAGSYMGNLCYNLSQNEKIPEHHRVTMKELTTLWDAATSLSSPSGKE